jgi:dTDP-4-amino-4,6-dideoxygalactose transaminase
LDEIQAALLRVKLERLDDGNRARDRIASRYAAAFSGLELQLLTPLHDAKPVHHLYPVRTPRRDELARHLAGHGIETLVHYPVPIHLQPAYRFLEGREGDFPVAERSCARLLSLPIYPTLPEDALGRVIDGVREFFGAG